MINTGKWDTIIHEKDIYFAELNDKGSNAKFVIETKSKEKFSVDLSESEFYLVCSEDHQVKYFSMTHAVGSTFIVKDSKLINYVFEDCHLVGTTLELSDLEHYVVSTYDTCLEIISCKPPIITAVN
jgi:hypothetical protein